MPQYSNTTNRVGVVIHPTRLRRWSDAWQTPGDGVIKIGRQVPKGSLSSVTGNATIVTPQQNIVVNCGNTNTTITLPNTQVYNGAEIRVKIDAGSGTGRVTLQPEVNTETIDGQSSEVLYRAGEAMSLACDGTNWVVTNRYYMTPDWDNAISSKTSGINQVVWPQQILLGTASGSAIYFDLPLAVEYEGVRVYCKKLDATAFIIRLRTKTGSGETIDGAANIDLSNQYDYVSVISDGTNWHIVTRNP
jgi:hypothetical protein